MFFNSIRFRLQLWYGIILIFVLSGFGFTAYQLERAREFRDLDAELNRRVSAITLALRPPPRERGPGERRAGPPPFEDPRPDGPPPRPNNRPFHNGAPEDFSPRLREFILPPQQERLFGGNETNSFYYIIWTRDGDEVSRSTNAPVDVTKPAGFLAAQTPEIRMRGAWREILFATPNRETILIGRSAAAELAELRRVLWRFFGVGGVIALLGLAGGWWIATRAIHPIEDISRTAGKIAAGDLTQRINIADMDTELGQLAGVLNSTFARLDAAFAQQTRFTADAAHELRTPVAVMLTQTQSALSRERSAADYRETIEACQRATQRMRRLIETLMVLARLDSGQETLQRTRFDLAQAVRECVESVKPLAAERGIQFECALNPVECVGASDQIEQVITNLLTNAIHYNKENGQVKLSTRQEDDTAILAIADTGQGISIEDLPHIFDRFFRVEKSRSSGRNGLGLAISKAIIEKHGGSIEVSSRLGEGTEFLVRLPLNWQKDDSV